MNRCGILSLMSKSELAGYFSVSDTRKRLSRHTFFPVNYIQSCFKPRQLSSQSVLQWSFSFSFNANSFLWECDVFVGRIFTISVFGGSCKNILLWRFRNNFLSGSPWKVWTSSPGIKFVWATWIFPRKIEIYRQMIMFYAQLLNFGHFMLLLWQERQKDVPT